MGAKTSVVLMLTVWLILPALNVQAQSAGDRTKVERQAQEVANRLIGVMDTSAQAATNPKAPSVRMTTCQVRVKNAAPRKEQRIFLYQEQSLTSNLAQPYRQRFLQISPSPYSESVQSLSFKPTTTDTWKGLCDRPEVDRSLEVGDLGQPVCSVFLRQVGTVFIGSTPLDGCPANYRGAVRITNRVVLSETGMETWDRGFDAQGKQVWGAQANSYQYRRLVPLSK
ncbi:MAG: chromophore lyase CpcT/CpeT [Scytolyngbya sp. HA4215-MV1]|nr:chromophore lyase CpcT/CpeT [Scytolyngbya sp. HA4215-MV1]